MNFASDNAGPVHPRVMQALALANEGYAPSYGTDVWTQTATRLIREAFEAPEAAVILVATGTAANSLALATLAAIGLWSLPIGTAAEPLEPPPLFRLGFGLALAIGVAFVALYARQVAAAVAAMGDALDATRLALARAGEIGKKPSARPSHASVADGVHDEAIVSAATEPPS